VSSPDRKPFLKRPERISVVVLGVSFVCHGLSFFMLYVPEISGQIPFLREARILVPASAACSLLAMFAPSVRAFVAAHVVRAVFVLVIGRILGPEHFLPEMLLLLPYLIETSLYLSLRRSVTINAMVIAVNLAFDVARLVVSPRPLVVANVGMANLLYASTAALWIQLVAYRETVVEYGRRITNLSNANLAFQDHAEYVESESASRERNRITRELHDVTAYALTNIAMTMNAAKVLLRDNPAELSDLFETTRRQAEDALQETRKTLYLLRSVEDRKLEGLHAFVHLARQFQQATGVAVQINYGNVPFSLGRDVDGLIYRLIQQGLTNAFRHGKADEVRVNLWRADTEIRVSISDNGRGSEEVKEGIGLRGMRERLAAVGGTLQPHSRPDGFDLSATIPLEACEIHE
jgi:signal transduction histidine kinase